MICGEPVPWGSGVTIHTMEIGEAPLVAHIACSSGIKFHEGDLPAVYAKAEELHGDQLGTVPLPLIPIYPDDGELGEPERVKAGPWELQTETRYLRIRQQRRYRQLSLEDPWPSDTWANEPETN